MLFRKYSYCLFNFCKGCSSVSFTFCTLGDLSLFLHWYSSGLISVPSLINFWCVDCPYWLSPSILLSQRLICCSFSSFSRWKLRCLVFSTYSFLSKICFILRSTIFERKCVGSLEENSMCSCWNTIFCQCTSSWLTECCLNLPCLCSSIVYMFYYLLRVLFSNYNCGFVSPFSFDAFLLHIWKFRY